ncbi:hypothetical protein pb186bvf_015507 [Paramecium bursaria]
MKLFMIATLILTSYIVLDLVYDQWLWNISINTTIYLQKHQFDGEILFFRIISYMLFVMPVFAVAGFLFVDQKMEILLYGFVVIITSNINSSLKLIYHQARPFMVTDEIQALECNGEFGKPSGHAMISSCLVFLLPAILYPGIYRVQASNTNYPLTVRILTLATMSLVVILTGISRVFLGVHSIGQILLGWAYTAYIIVIYINYIHQPTKLFLSYSLQRGGQGLSNRFLINLTIFQIVWIMWNLLWQLLDKDVFIKNNELQNWLRAVENCYGYVPQSLNKNSPSILYNICFIQTQVFGFIYGCCIGIRQSKGIVIENTFSLNYRNINRTSKFYRIILLFLLIFLLLPFLFIRTDQTYVQAFLQIYLMTFLADY